MIFWIGNNFNSSGNKSKNWRIREGDDIRKGCSRVNMVQILNTHVCKWENETCWNYSRTLEVLGGGIKENDGGGEFKYDIFD
jgi:hypothetical protein